MTSVDGTINVQLYAVYQDITAGFENIDFSYADSLISTRFVPMAAPSIGGEMYLEHYFSQTLIQECHTCEEYHLNTGYTGYTGEQTEI